MNWSGKKVMVTGADGFIGSHLVERLVKEGAEVTALALYNSFDQFGWLDDLPPTTLRSVRPVRGSIVDPGHMRTLANGQDVVFHLAALIAIPFSYDEPSYYVDNNVKGTCNVLQACLDGGVQRLVHISTSEVYGTAQFVPMTEDHPLSAQSPYAASKIGADMLAHSFARSFGLPAVILRPFNTYGPRQSERAVISAIIRQAVDPRCEAIKLGDLSPKRDFTYVEDTAAAMMAVAGVDDSQIGKVFNSGSGQMITVGQLAEEIIRIVGTNKPIQSDQVRQRPADSEVLVLQADTTRLRNATGWQPAVGLKTGLERTVAWWTDRIAKGRVRLSDQYMT